jgi:uncharacterized protein (DUF433 family)
VIFWESQIELRDVASLPHKGDVNCVYNPIQVNSMQHTKSLEKIFTGLSRADKAQLLQWVARDLGDAFPGIESNPQVCGGEPCIVRTRIPVWLLVQARRLGTSEAELLHAYPTLRAEDLANAWAYERSHRKEIDAQIRVNEEA